MSFLTSNLTRHPAQCQVHLVLIRQREDLVVTGFASVGRKKDHGWSVSKTPAMESSAFQDESKRMTLTSRSIIPAKISLKCKNPR